MKRPPSDGDTLDRRSVHISRGIFNRCITREGAFYPAVLKQWSSHVSFNQWNRCDFFNTGCPGKAMWNGKVVFGNPLWLFLGQGSILHSPSGAVSVQLLYAQVPPGFRFRFDPLLPSDFAQTNDLRCTSASKSVPHWLIVEGGGIGPLLKVIKETITVEAREVSAKALGELGKDPQYVSHMIQEGVCSVFAKDLKDDASM